MIIPGVSAIKDRRGKKSRGLKGGRERRQNVYREFVGLDSVERRVSEGRVFAISRLACHDRGETLGILKGAQEREGRDEDFEKNLC